MNYQVRNLYFWCRRDVLDIMASPISIYYHWRIMPNGDLNYRRWVAGIFFPHNPCPLIVYTKQKTSSFSLSKVPTVERIQQLLAANNDRVIGVRPDDTTVRFTTKEYAVAAPRHFVVSVCASLLLEHELDVSITRRQAPAANAPGKKKAQHLIVFHDGNRLAGFLNGWLQ